MRSDQKGFLSKKEKCTGELLAFAVPPSKLQTPWGEQTAKRWRTGRTREGKNRKESSSDEHRARDTVRGHMWGSHVDAKVDQGTCEEVLFGRLHP